MALGFLPVLLFLLCLFLLDSFRLASPVLLIYCIIWGMVSAALSFFLNSFLATHTHFDFETISLYIAPFGEELLKAIPLFYLIKRRRIGFMIDAAIYGFALGTGFALVENTWYFLSTAGNVNMLLAIIRGFGTAIMHGGTTALLAIILIEGVLRSNRILAGAIPGLMLAMILHSGFNHFLFNPLLQALLIILILPGIFYLVFLYSTSHLQQWLEVEFSNEVEMLRMMRQGIFTLSRSGTYLTSLREHFTPHAMVDMYCFFSLYLELSIKAKRNLMLRESGIPVIIESDIKEKLLEMSTLRKQIGKAGEMALKPLVRMSYRKLWELNQLDTSNNILQPVKQHDLMWKQLKLFTLKK